MNGHITVNRRCSRTWLAAGLALALAAPALANGFRNPPEGANALGRAGGKIATIDDASAVTHNPANLMDLTNATALAALTIARSKTEFTSPLGPTAETDNPWALLPNMFGVLPVGREWTFGLGVTTPFGQATKWPDDSFFRYTAPYEAQVVVVNVNPVAATRIGKQLYLALGMDVYVSDLTLKQFFPWSALLMSPALPDGRAEFSGDGVGYGLNAALTWKITDAQRLGLTVRTPVRVDYDGHFTVNNVPPPALMMGVQARSDFSTRIDYPATIGLGYGIRLLETVQLGVDVEWVNFSQFDQLPLDIGPDNVLLPARTIPEQWNDSWTCGFGLDWQFLPGWVVRGGYVFLQSPVPDDTLAPTLPDTDTHVMTLGLGYRHGRHAVDLGYALNFYEDRTIADSYNPAYNGKYETSSQLISVSYGISF